MIPTNRIIYCKENHLFRITIKETHAGNFLVTEWNKMLPKEEAQVWNFESESGANLQVIQLLGEWLDAAITVNEDNLL